MKTMEIMKIMKKNPIVENKIKSYINIFNKEIEKYKDLPNIEIEFRLGKLVDNILITDIGANKYNKILDKIKFDKVNNIIDYFYDNKRLSIGNGNVIQCISKNVLVKLDIPIENTEYTIRCSISEEKNQEIFDEKKSKLYRNKTRMTKYFNNSVLDITSVECNGDLNYEVEIEIKSLDSDNYFIVYDSLLKLGDILRLIIS